MVDLEPPTERNCERCGRREVWDDDGTTWRAPSETATADRGNAHCLHEWDINGTYNPLAE